MPQFNSDILTEFPGGGHYGFSGARVEKLEANEYTLVTIVLDESGSTNSFRNEMIACIKALLGASKKGPRADFVLFRLVNFAERVKEFHGFLPLEQCHLANYDNCYGGHGLGGATALYDAVENAVRSTNAYAKILADQDFDVNSLTFIITDGNDNNSASGVNEVKTAFDASVSEEALESSVNLLIGVNVKQAHISKFLNDFNKDAGFNDYIEIENANEQTLSKLAGWGSSYISSQSQALGSGGPSQSLVF